MHPSDSFLHKLRKLRKQLREAESPELEPRIKEAFMSSVPTLPEALTEELFRHFYGKLQSAASVGPAPADTATTDNASAHTAPETGGDDDTGQAAPESPVGPVPVSSVDDHIDRAEGLADVVDLLCEDYDEREDPIEQADWPVIRDAFSAYATELDMRTVNYIMRLVVDHRAT